MNKGIGQLLLALASVVARLVFTAYRALVTAIGVGIGTGLVAGLGYWVLSAVFSEAISVAVTLRYWAWATLALTMGVLLASGKGRSLDNPYRRYVGFWGGVSKGVDQFIAWIGTLKYFTRPVSLVEDPGSYKIKGDEIRTLIDTVLQPGDILLRGYDGYLDGVMIGLSGGGSAASQRFSHAALFVDDLHDDPDKPIVARRLQVMDDQGQWRDGTDAEKTAVRNNPDYYQSGRQRVVHAMTRGVFTEDILTFVRCDYLAVLRLPETMTLNEDARNAFSPLVAHLAQDAASIQDRLMSGQTVTRAEVVERVHLSALGRIGSCYDFQFTDGKTHHRFSCSEFVYYCFKSVHAYIGLRLVKHGFMKFFFVRETITPGDVYEAAQKAGKLQVVWTSRSLGI